LLERQTDVAGLDGAQTQPAAQGVEQADAGAAPVRREELRPAEAGRVQHAQAAALQHQFAVQREPDSALQHDRAAERGGGVPRAGVSPSRAV